MRATLNIPDELISDLMRETGTKTKTQAISLAIQDYVKRRRLERLLKLQGNLSVEDVTEDTDAAEMKESAQDGERWSDR